MNQALIDQVLDLSPADKARLVETIIASLDKPDQDIDAVWRNEAQARADEVDTGSVEGIPAREAHARRQC